jgi:hypothetical protein
MKWTEIAALGVVTALYATSAGAAPASRDAVRAILRAPESKARTAADWRALGDDVDAQLVAAASDAQLVYGARQRAIAALGIVGGPRAKAYLDGVLVKPDAAAPLLSSAVEAYARAFAKEEPALAQQRAAAVLANPDWQARRGAARAMGIIGGNGALAALRAQQARETHPAVRSAIDTALKGRAAGR